MIEKQTLEYKREYNQKAQNTMLAFLNTDGGTLYIGISDDGSVYGLSDNIDEETRRITKWFQRTAVTSCLFGHSFHQGRCRRRIRY